MGLGSVLVRARVREKRGDERKSKPLKSIFFFLVTLIKNKK